ncbi:MAG: EAL domain-containing protein [Actinomycetota bacterium]
MRFEGLAEQPAELRWFSRQPSWVWLTLIVVLTVASWMVTYAAGGTRTAWPHLFYFPITIGALAFGKRGGVAAGLLATVASGPLLPLDTVAGVDQSLGNWLTRGGFFVGLGLLIGATVTLLRHSVEERLAAHLRFELDRPERSRETAAPADVARIRRTIDEHDFHVVYQPIYALDDGRLLAVEALTRFDGEPQRTPDVWFDEAAHAGLGSALDLAAAEAALAGVASLPTHVTVHLNVLPATLHEPGLLQLVTSYRRHRLVLEVTEHDIIDDYPAIASVRDELAAHNVTLAVDDVGAGFASLRHIVRLGPDVLKLDISLTQNVQHDPIRHALAEALVGFASSSGLQLIAEGVEQPDELQAWRRLGADAAQGFLLAPPGDLPVPATCERIARARLGVGTN